MAKSGNIESAGAYRVLARKYRPQSFDDLIGQDAMVRVLKASFATSRIPHAYMLTGVRGVGKTTTARLLAIALNYDDGRGNAQPTLDFGDWGIHGQAIAESRHIDVLEMDAASRTGIDDIREIIEAAKFKPASAPFKIYIIDEVHMLSKAAFNGLLKILEEPPAHVKFIFATTEIRKVPVTVLSRCQRFDLKRVVPADMIAHLQAVAKKEGVKIDADALALIARASEGSVRDALSLLDQAIAQGAAPGGATQKAAAKKAAAIGAAELRDMLGLADRERVLDLLEHLLSGDIAKALDELRAQHDLGADPLEVMRDLLDLTHWLTSLHIAGGGPRELDVSEALNERGLALAKRLSVPTLTRTWQILLKGLQEAIAAPRPLDAAEMVLIRLAFAADLPAPAELVRQLTERPETAPARGPAGGEAGPATRTGAPGPGNGGGASGRGRTAPKGAKGRPGKSGPRPSASLQLDPGAFADDIDAPVGDEADDLIELPAPQSFDDLIALATEMRDLQFRNDLERYVHLVQFEPGRLEFRPADDAPDDLAGRIGRTLEDWTGTRWVVSISNVEGAETRRERRLRRRAEEEERVREHPMVKAAFRTFPGARIVAVRDLGPPVPDEE